MNEKLRDAIGLAIYKQSVEHFNPAQGTPVPWNELLEDTREHYRLCGEKAVEAFLAPFMPAITTLAQELIKNNPGMEYMMREAWKQAIGRELEV